MLLPRRRDEYHDGGFALVPRPSSYSTDASLSLLPNTRCYRLSMIHAKASTRPPPLADKEHSANASRHASFAVMKGDPLRDRAALVANPLLSLPPCYAPHRFLVSRIACRRVIHPDPVCALIDRTPPLRGMHLAHDPVVIPTTRAKRPPSRRSRFYACIAAKRAPRLAGSHTNPSHRDANRDIGEGKYSYHVAGLMAAAVGKTTKTIPPLADWLNAFLRKM